MFPKISWLSIKDGVQGNPNFHTQSCSHVFNRMANPGIWLKSDTISYTATFAKYYRTYFLQNSLDNYF